MIDSTPEQVIEQKIGECGLNRTGVTVAYEDYLQSIEVVIKPEAKATSDHFQCIHNASGYEIVTFTDMELAKRYEEFTAELLRPKMLEDARQSLKKLGRFDNFPTRDAFPSNKLYAEALESHCGVERGSVLKEFGEWITFQPLKADLRDVGAFHDKYNCLFAAIYYALATGDLKDFGFVGNGQYVSE